jgi:hypothetical protein
VYDLQLDFRDILVLHRHIDLIHQREVFIHKLNIAIDLADGSVIFGQLAIIEAGYAQIFAGRSGIFSAFDAHVDIDLGGSFAFDFPSANTAIVFILADEIDFTSRALYNSHTFASSRIVDLNKHIPNAQKYSAFSLRILCSDHLRLSSRKKRVY